MLLHSCHRAALLLLSYWPLLAYSRSIPAPVRDIATTKAATIETAQESGNTYARTLKLTDGSLLLGYTHIDGTVRTLEISRSTNEGQSFEPYGQISRRDSNADMDNIFLLEVGSTTPPTVLAAFRNHDKDDSGDYTYFRITVCRSKDGGKTWHFASQAVEYPAAATGGWGVWEPFLRVGDDGKVQLTYSRELAADNQETFRTISRDGSSWSRSVNLKIHKDGENLRDGMQGIMKVKDQGNGRNALVMVFETTTRGLHSFNVEYAVSYDDGATWGHRSNVYTPPDGKQAGSPQIVSTGNNDMAVLFMTDESTATQDWPTVAEVKSVTGHGLKNGVVEWTTKPQVVSDGDSHWPGLLEFDGKVLATYEQSGVIKGQFITSTS